MGKKFIPVNQVLLDGNEHRYINKCLDEGWISSVGPFVERFEKEFADYIGRRYGVAVSSGSAALDVAVAALRLGPGDEVIIPALTIISCISPIIKCGATPVLVDVDPLTWNMDVTQVKDRITAKTRAIMAVHLYGLPVDMEPIIQLAEKHGLAIIEDAAEAHGQTYRGKRCGSFGELSIFSFYANKHVTTGEGGMVLTDDNILYKRCRSLRNLCFQEGKLRFTHEEIGWNYRMSNLQAALGVAQLEQLSRHVDKKRAIGSYYTRHLSGISGLILPLEETDYAKNIYWVYGLVLSEDMPYYNEEIIDALAQHKIDSRPFFLPMHKQPVFHKMGLFREERYPTAENLAQRGFYIPSGLGLAEEEQSIVVAILEKILS